MVVGYRGLVVGYGILFLDPRHPMCHFVFVVALNLSKSTVGIWDNALYLSAEGKRDIMILR